MSKLYETFLNRIRGRVERSLFSGVPAPSQDIYTLYRTVDSLKQGYEQLTRGRGSAENSAVLVKELGEFSDLLLTELTNTGRLQLSEGPVPRLRTSPGTPGTVVVTTDYVYICWRLDRWTRIAVAEW